MIARFLNTFNSMTLQLTSMTLFSTLVDSLKSGPYGIIALTVVASLVLVPIAQYRSMYVISVGYGLAIATIGATLNKIYRTDISTAASGILVASLLLYGFRLATYLLIRDLGGWKPTGFKKSQTQMARWKRVPFAVVIAFLYACMTYPVLQALRRPAPDDTVSQALSYGGAYLAILAALLEAVADGHKAIAKNKAKPDQFVGPTRGLYALTRHPNYTAEVLYWAALFVAAIPSYDVPSFMYSTFGLLTIIIIMMGSSNRLERKQQERYGQNAEYQAWIRNVPYPLVPGVKKMPAAENYVK
jgi:steroid 5-alpha reductase family enzyme